MKTIKKLLKQTKKELKKNSNQSGYVKFMQLRSEYLMEYIDLLKAKAPEFQRRSLVRMERLRKERNMYQDKAIDLQEKYNRLKKECENNKNVTINVA